MGKLSKRNNQQGKTSTGPSKQQRSENTSQCNTRGNATSHQEEKETPDNLKYEDPFADEYEEEEEIHQGGDESMELVGNEDKEILNLPVRSWNPLTCEPLEPGTTLEMDETAYKMHHSLIPEWSSLSFNILRDTHGDNRTRFPHTILAAVGTQADRADQNKVIVMKLSDLSRTGGASNKNEKDEDDEIMGEKYDTESDNEDDEDDDDNAGELEPVLEHFSLNHHGGVNRLRCMPQHPEIIATWSDTGVVNLFDVSGVLQSFERPTIGVSSTSSVKGNNSSLKIRKTPFFVYQGHDIEGYAMDWSKVTPGVFATGDCHGDIHLWQPAGSCVSDKNWTTSSFHVTKAYGPSPTTSNKKNASISSVEDIQWSPTEATVFATGECAGFVKIYDIRCKGRPMISNKIHESGSDVNVISWNALVSNLLASGGHDGVFSVWDLRNFQSQPSKPLARFNCHKKPITSLEWHPTDESMILVTDDDATYIYDLSIEEDDAAIKEGLEGIPPQLLFIHCGSEQIKEAHWHPQIPSCVMTTSLSGIDAFIPSNL